MLIDEELKRKKKAEVDIKMGYFNDKFYFIEGEAMVSLKK
jgi:hypothetical protein